MMVCACNAAIVTERQACEIREIITVVVVWVAHGTVYRKSKPWVHHSTLRKMQLIPHELQALGVLARCL